MARASIGRFLGGLLAATGLCAAQPLTFVHTTDTHVAATDAPGSHAHVNAALYAEINAHAPAFVVQTGDLTEIGTPREYEVYRASVSGLSAPRYDSPGNHDVRWNPLGKEGYVAGTGQPLWQTWEAGGVQFFLLDSTVLLQHWGHIDQHQLDWLRGELERIGPEKPVVIGFHHPIGIDRVYIDNETQLMELTAPYNVRLWLQGHGHSDRLWNINGAPAVMAKGLYQGSYHIVTVDGDALSVRRRAIPAASPTTQLLDAPPAPPAEHREVVSVPLAKQAAPEWSFKAQIADAQMTLVVSRGGLPQEAEVAWRLNDGKFEPVPQRGAGGFVAQADLADADAGRHRVTVRASLTDGRTYFRSGLVDLRREAAPEAAWRAPLGAAVQSRLVRDGERLYVTTMGGSCLAIDPSDGEILWRFDAGGAIFSTPHVEAGTVYVGSADHHVYALDAATGSLRWRTRTGGGVFAGAALAGGVVCIASVDGRIYGLDADDGTVRWTSPVGNMVQSKVATDGARFYLGAWDNIFRCLDAATGSVVWQRKLGREQTLAPNFSAFSPAITSPAVGGGRVYVSTNDGDLHALDLLSGETAWKIDVKNMGYSSPLYRDGRVYAALGDEGRVFCVDAASGEYLWQAETGSVIYDSSFAYGGGRVFIGNVNGTLNALDADSGAVAWRYRLGPGHLLASPAADEQRVYAASMAGDVVALPVAVAAP